LEALASCNTVATEAVFEILVEKGILTKEEVKERIDRLKKTTQLTIKQIN
jgi:hypothetical protein